MQSKYFLSLALAMFFIAFSKLSYGQLITGYSVELKPVNVPGLTGLHSYAFAQHEGKWLVIGGRKDGVHARQPFSAFPQLQNNTDIYVVDVAQQKFWSASVDSLPTGIREQLQSTNMSFYQDDDTLYIIGGYAFSATAADHITFPNLTSVVVSSVIDVIISGQPISSFFKQIKEDNFAVTGGQLGKIGNTFYLVGGHRFDGRYNPMNNPTFTQTYTNQIRKFNLSNSGTELKFSGYTAITDAVHLHRRDYNLLPQIFPDGKPGYTISSGVFQVNVDLPYLYPVDIREDGYKPVTGFNQYLSNYHSAKAALYDSIFNQMHTFFFGGISQYYYKDGTLVQDNQVPFVKTISRLTRFEDGSLQEVQLPVEMPALKGAGAEFIPNRRLPHYDSEIIKFSGLTGDTILLGHIYGGILSPALNPFSNNQANTTSANNTIYKVRLVKNSTTSLAYKIDGSNPYDIRIFPNPVDNSINIGFGLNNKEADVKYFVTGATGQILKQGRLQETGPGENNYSITLDENTPPQTLLVTFIFEDKFYVTKKIVKN